MKKITNVNLKLNKSCCGTADKTVAQCCAKHTKVVMGCHD